MPSHDTSRTKPRRDFLIKTALMGAAALFGGRAGRSARAAVPPTDFRRNDGRYRLTAHIRRYYERASF